MITLPFGLFRRRRLTTDQQDALLSDLDSLLQRIEATLEQFGPDIDPADLKALSGSRASLRELFLIVVAGEFNSGKSTFLNALLGAQVLPEGVTPTTDAITLLKYGDEAFDELIEPGLRLHHYPAEMLRQLIVVDTPGTNAVIRQHERLTRDYIPRADLVIFLTSADRPFTESERAFLELIKEWGKKIVVVINKADILTPAEQEQVAQFVREHVNRVLEQSPELFMVSARRALQARQQVDGSGNEQWQASGMAAIEHFVVNTLDEETRFRLKVLSPLGVARRITTRYLEATEARLATLRDDIQAIEQIERQLTLFGDDLKQDAEYHLAEIDRVLVAIQERGDRFCDETIRLGRIRELLDGNRLRAAFEQEVIGDAYQQLDQRVQKLIDWLMEKNLRLQQSVDEFVQQRALAHRDRILGNIGGSFDYNRQALLDSIGRAAQTAVTGYNRQQEAQQLASEVQSSVAATAITGVGALGLGATLVAIFHTVLLDMTGILAALTVAGLGLAILPARRRQAKETIRKKIDEVRNQLRAELRQQIERESERTLQQIRERNAPFIRFVRSQQTHLLDLQRAFSDLAVTVEKLSKQIEQG
ncbi:dynamin family protein [Chloroflexus sp.]|uniref:dynamin family protein n=1 Tax=Chloroflexus sp. TaxID=1904827 RepID=UPI0026156E3B|nr:dynamin family protein [uncultured Chloroflexus sp.]